MHTNSNKQTGTNYHAFLNKGISINLLDNTSKKTKEFKGWELNGSWNVLTKANSFASLKFHNFLMLVVFLHRPDPIRSDRRNCSNAG